MDGRHKSGFSLRDGLALTGIGLDELWLHYLALGGRSDLESVRERITDETDPVPSAHRLDHDLLAQALNEVFLDQDLDNFPVGYARPTPARAAPGGFWARAEAARRNSAFAAALAAVLQERAAAVQAATGHHAFAHNAAARGRAARDRAVAMDRSPV